MIGLKIAATIVGIYGGIAIAKLAIEWIGELIEKIRPTRYR